MMVAHQMPLANAYDRWQDAVNDYINNPSREMGNAVDDALEALVATAFQAGWDPNGSLGLKKWVMREIAG